MYDMRRHVTYLNPAHTRIFGWTLEEAQGCSIPVVPPWDRDKNVEVVDRLLNHEIPCATYEAQRYTKSGELVDVSISASPCYDHKGNPTGFLVIYRDISSEEGRGSSVESYVQGLPGCHRSHRDK